MKYRANSQDTWHKIKIKALDSMPVGTIVDFDGQVSDIPSGWEQASDNRVVLYENATGTSSEITLSDNYTNYSYIEVYYGWWSNNMFEYGQTMSKVDLASSDRIILTYNLCGGGWYINLYECWYFNNNNKLSLREKHQKNQSGDSGDTQTRIAKVVGYK